MENQIKQVTAFHRKIGETISESPNLLQHDAALDGHLAQTLRRVIESFNRPSNPKTALTRRALMEVEELAEWIEAHIADDVVAAADAWADRVTVLLGDAVATGMPAQPLLDEVHRSNMTKVAANERTGKGVKRDGYQPPDIQTILNRPTLGDR
ncbi:hypothetical protein [Rosistilla oblonga]|uniref:hypothetical protein n=1 Tax=Rosistilla oblonga TaxID=2527990 RepID=UPI003A969BAF